MFLSHFRMLHVFIFSRLINAIFFVNSQNSSVLKKLRLIFGLSVFFIYLELKSHYFDKFVSQNFPSLRFGERSFVTIIFINWMLHFWDFFMAEIKFCMIFSLPAVYARVYVNSQISILRKRLKVLITPCKGLLIYN